MTRARLDQLGPTPVRADVVAAIRARLAPRDADARARLVASWRKTWGWAPCAQWIAQRLAREAVRT